MEKADERSSTPVLVPSDDDADGGEDLLALVADLNAVAAVHAANVEAASQQAEKTLNCLLSECGQLDGTAKQLLEQAQKEADSSEVPQQSEPKPSDQKTSTTRWSPTRITPKFPRLGARPAHPK